MRTSSVKTRRQSEQGGFALLMVFLMAAIVALMLYQQLPRVAFESEREKRDAIRLTPFFSIIRIWHRAWLCSRPAWIGKSHRMFGRGAPHGG